ncbi:MAG: AMP-dependent synthetase [Sneathiella sp.]|jgi:phenylacetate-CoA ligase|uniref:phenylacetate--CoA ligase family protein n=1 Tax=Sneathiella sp. TaxID=1964365 RepID=UPI000C452D0A|nr:hypothetical protein [Sneathiella sp.]MAL77784.1 AMP-dependent synthetase [Sneathiella sp.]
MTFYDELEVRSADERAAAQSRALREILSGLQGREADLEKAGQVRTIEDLPQLPVFRKSNLSGRQAQMPPFGGMLVTNATHVFQSPGPIYEPGRANGDWARLGRFLHAAGIGAGDIVQNCFAYHLTPAGMMFDSAAQAIGAMVLPAGTGQTDLQVRAAKDVKCTAYAGTPDYLKIILDRADELGVTLHFKRAVVGGGALFASLRQEYADRGILCLQNYATADLGNVAYETDAQDGMIVDEHVIVEIVTPGTGNPVAAGEVGEVVVTCLNPDYPLIRFATGDLSAVLPGQSPCGRTNMRIKGWMGRADQATKIKGMFVRPEQVAELVKRYPEIKKARVVVSRQGEKDEVSVLLEADDGSLSRTREDISAILKLSVAVEVVAPGSLPNDGKVIDDQRVYDS